MFDSGMTAGAANVTAASPVIKLGTLNGVPSASVPTNTRLSKALRLPYSPYPYLKWVPPDH